MPKRIAEEYITKDHGSTPQLQPAQGNEKPQMMTAAQAARRKIAQPRGRIAGSNRPSAPPSSNPFSLAGSTNNNANATASNNAASTPSSQAMNPGSQPFGFGGASGGSQPFGFGGGQPSGGFQFGGSQSFPPSQQPSSSQPGFTFQPQSTSFTFGDTSSTPNPFAALSKNSNATMNGTTDGMELNVPAADDVDMASPQKKRVNNAAFGFNTEASGTNGSGGFSFGAVKPATQQPSSGGFAFGSQDNKPAQNGGSNTGTNGFSFGGFGQSQAPAQNPLPAFNFAQSAAPSTSAPAFSFGQSAPASAPAPAATSAPFSFGQPAAAAPSASKFSFGQPATTNASESKTPAFGFGQNTSTPPSSSEARSDSKPLFGAAPLPPFGQPATNNPFGKLAANKGQEAQNSAPNSTSLFGSPKPAPQEPASAPASSSSPAEAQKPFAGLFNAHPATAPTAATPKPTFSFGVSSQPKPAESVASESATPKPSNPFTFGTKTTGSDQAQPSTATSGAESGKSAQKPLFGFPPSQQPSSGGLFSPAKGPAAPAESAASSFGKSSKPSSSESDNTAAAQPKAPLFQKLDSSANPTTSNQATDDASGRTTTAPPNMFAQSQTPKGAATPQSTSAHPAATPKSQSLGASTPSVSEPPAAAQSFKRTIYTKAPSMIPSHLNAEEYREYDRKYRLHSLNAGFQERIARLDPRTQDFEALVRQYVASRMAIGANIGLYVRAHAGMKHKGDHIEAPEDGGDGERGAKRQRPSDSQPDSQSKPATNMFASSTASQQQPGTPQPPASDEAPARFKSMIPGTGAGFTPQPSSASKPATNMFATSTPAQSNAKKELFPSATAGATTSNQLFGSAPSTTPTKSPPKKPTFEMPKPSGANNFMSAFGQQAKANSDKFSKALLEKRKAEDFDSDEDDEAAFDKEAEEEARAKKAKIEAIAKAGFKPTFGSSGTPANSGSGMPKPPSGNTPNFLSAFGQQAQKNADKFSKDLLEKRKAEDFDSEEEDEADFDKKAAAEAHAKKSQIEAISKGGFTPSFGNSNTAAAKSPFSFGSTAGASQAAEKSTPKFNFGSSTGAMKQPEPSKPKFNFGTANSLTSGKSSAFNSTPSGTPTSKDNDVETDDQEESEDSSGNQGTDGDEETGEDDSDEQRDASNADQESNADSDKSITLEEALARSRKNPNAGKSLFDRIERPPSRESTSPINGEKKEPSPPIMGSAKNSTFPPSVWGANIGHSTPETPTASPFTPALGSESYKPATTFNFTPKALSSSVTPTPGASIFAGGITRDGPVPGEGLFGSRPSTPNSAERPAPPGIGNSLLKPKTPGTYKQGDPIVFAGGDQASKAPALNVTAPSPEKLGSTKPNPFGSLFGTPAAGTDSPKPTLGFSFGNTSTPAPGFLSAAPHLGASVGGSAASSRATSPAVTDTESVNTNDSEDKQDDPQVSLMSSTVGEENEDVLYESKSKALQRPKDGGDYKSMGLGVMKLLKDKTTGKTRLLFRIDPGGAILINSHLLKGAKYEDRSNEKSGVVVGILVDTKGVPQQWVLKVKTPAMASQLVGFMEANKGN